MTPIRKAPVALPEATRHEPTQRRNRCLSLPPLLPCSLPLAPSTLDHISRICFPAVDSDGTSARQDPPLLPLPPTPPRGTVRSGSDVLFDDHGFLLERGPPSHPNSVASPRSLGDSPHGISRRSRKPGALGLQRLSAPVVGRSADTPRGLTPVRATPRDVSPPPPAPSPAPGAGHWSRRQSSSAVRRDLTLIVDDSPHTAPRPAESGLSPNAPVRPHPVAAMATSLSATPALGAADGAAHPIARTSPAVPPGASATPPSAVSVESDPAPTTDRTAPAPLIPGAESVPAHSGGPGTRGGPRLVVFSGGTAFNTVASSLSTLSTRVAHVLPVSDDGGSTAEIVRVLGGPAVGDIRSRCLRLADTRDAESLAVARLLAHRLPGTSAGAAKAEWYEIVEGDHALWEGVSEPYKHTIRAFLVHFQANILRHSSERFDFRNGSVGNFFFAGARIFFRSLEVTPLQDRLLTLVQDRALVPGRSGLRLSLRLSLHPPRLLAPAVLLRET